YKVQRQTNLKQMMMEAGFSSTEIERVVHCGPVFVNCWETLFTFFVFLNPFFPARQSPDEVLGLKKSDLTKKHHNLPISTAKLKRFGSQND
ncbi:MAG: hypothetical protein P8M80_11750, partial [Pirellulaceae bacterium]|nr:hypothetical protein [Pirellulaceae bacterium]